MSNNKTTPEEKQRAIAALGWRAHMAIDTIEQARKQRGQVYSDRVKELRNFIRDLTVKQIDPQQLDLFDGEAEPGDKIRELLDRPLHGLD